MPPLFPAGARALCRALALGALCALPAAAQDAYRVASAAPRGYERLAGQQATLAQPQVSQ